MNVIEVAIADIQVRDRLRTEDRDWVEGLAHSIAERGLQHPIQVTAADKRGKRQLVAGLHRVQAFRLLERERIPAIEFRGTKLERRLAEIDENLFNRPLSALDRAAFLAERKSVYEALNPETKNGAQGGPGGNRNENGIFPFSKEVAERMGVSVSTIEKAVQLHKRLATVRARIAGTWIAEKGSELKALARLDPTRQGVVVDLLLRKTEPAESVGAAVKMIDGTGADERTPEERQLDRLVDMWMRAGPGTRAGFLAKLRELGDLEMTARAA